MTRRRAAGLLALGMLALALASMGFSAWVPDREMAPSYLPGDIVMILPLAPREGDVVALVDPLDAERWTLRRVESTGGAVRYDGRAFRTSSTPRVRQLDMGEFEGEPVVLEGTHVVSRRPEPTRAAVADVGVPDDAVYLSADARDAALDSRWWGPVPLTHVRGVVVARVGNPRTPWRAVVGWRGEEAVVPASSRLGPAEGWQPTP